MCMKDQAFVETINISGFIIATKTSIIVKKKLYYPRFSVPLPPTGFSVFFL